MCRLRHKRRFLISHNRLQIVMLRPRPKQGRNTGA
jgi:hypothetical protein